MKKLNDLELITGIEAVSIENKVWFFGPTYEDTKSRLREKILPNLIYGGNDYVHIGRHQYDDVPDE